MNRQQKQKNLEKLRPLFEHVNFYIIDVKGLSAEQVYKLRSMMLEVDVACRVVPNALLAMLFKGAPYEKLGEALKQSSMICFSKENPGVPAKIIAKFKKEEKTDSPSFKGGWIIEQVFLGEENFDRLVALKSREEMLAEIIGLLQSPSRQLFAAIQSSQNKLCRVLETIKKQ